MNTKQQMQAIASLVMAAAAAGVAAMNDGINLEAGPTAAIVAVALAVLSGVGWLVPDNNPAPSSIAAVLKLRDQGKV